MSAARGSAIVLTVGLPHTMRRIRAAHDPMAGVGVPPHVTLLYPWVPGGDLTSALRAPLAALAASHPPFGLTLDGVGRFDDTLYLAPSPIEPIRALITDLVAAFPAHPSYGGSIVVEKLVPHVTVASGVDGSTMDRLDDSLRGDLPIQATITSLVVIAEGEDGRWRTRWRVRLGGE